MKYSMMMAAVLLACCNKPVVPEAEAAEVKTEEMVVAEATPPAPEAKAEPEAEAAPEPEVEPEPPKPKKENLSEGRCRKLLYQFDQCGWRCSSRGANPGFCVRRCRALLNSQTKVKCLRLWGPGFG